MKKIFLTGLLFSAILFGGTTGKITGIITTASAGDPLIGCNVVIPGTDLGAATDIYGQYFILNVPPGIYDVKAIMIGYTPVVSQAVQVNVDLTSTVDFALNIEVLGGKEVTVVAKRSLIKMDLTSSETRVSAEQLEIMPVNTIWDVLAVQGGVTKDAGGGIHIRGGRGREVAYWVDGVSVTDAYDGGLSVAIDNSSIQELQVISGTFNAEYGQSMSGIINLVTKDGGSDYHGQISVYGAGFYTDDKHLIGLDKFNITDEKDIEGSLSGQLPGLAKRLTFYTHFRYNNSNGWLNAYKIYDKDGTVQYKYNYENFWDWYINGNKAYEPEFYYLNAHARFNTNTKLTLNLFSGLKLRFSYMTSTEEYQDYRHEAQWSPEGELHRFNSGRNLKLSLTHSLSSRTFCNIDLTRFSKNYHHYAYEKVTNSNYIDPYFWFHQEFASAVSAFKIWGVDHARFERQTDTEVAKFDLTSQFTRIHLIKFGVEYRRHDLFLDDYSIQDADQSDTVFTIKIPGEHYFEQDNSTGQWGVYNTYNSSLIQSGFDSKSKVTEFSDFYTKYVEYNRRYYEENPVEFSVYLQDKIEFKSVIINLGLRYDWFNSNGVVPTNKAEPYLGNPRNPFIDSLSYEARENINWTDYAQYYASSLPDSGASLIGASGWWTPVEATQQISPRLGIAYPITDKGVIHFSFGHFFQIPSFERLFTSPGYKIAEESGKFGVFGNPGLKPQKTVTYELGLKQEILPGLSIDVTGYYRDVRDWISTGIPIDLYGGGASYFVYVNKDYSNVRGITLNIDRRLRGFYGFSLNYTFQIAEGSNSDPDEEFGAIRDNKEPTRAILPLDWDQRHTINGSFFFGGRNWNLSLLGQIGSGYPYTPTTNISSTSGISTSTVLKTNSRRKPITYNLDLNFLYNLPLSQIDTQLYVKVLNVLDRRNQNEVFGDTGRADQTLDMRGDENENRSNSIADFYQHPEWFSSPRQIQIGLKFSF